MTERGGIVGQVDRDTEMGATSSPIPAEKEKKQVILVILFMCVYCMLACPLRPQPLGSANQLVAAL